MENIVSEVSNYIESYNTNESLNALVREIIKKKDKPTKVPRGYYIVTQLSNPIQAYWDIKGKAVKKSAELRRKLSLGTQLHAVAGVWFSKLPDFLIEEGKIDGAYVDVVGVRGSLDFWIGNSIFELKTKEKIPETIEEIIEEYPNDLEQLVFYSALHPSYPKENYLVYMKDSAPYNILVFKITVKNHNNIKNIIRSRIKLLNEAVESDDPSKLGRCRYYNKKCPYNENKICNCETLDKISIDNILRDIEITLDSEYTKTLNEIKDEKVTTKNIYYKNHLLAPRKYFLKNILGIEEDYDNSFKEEYMAFLDSAVRELDLNLNIEEKDEVRNNIIDNRFCSAFRWIKLKSSTNTNDLVVPYIVKVSDLVDDMKYTKKPGTYFMSELGIIASNYNKTKGVIFVIYPHLNDFIQAFEINFKSPKKIFNIVKNTLDNLDTALDEDKLHTLAPCPIYMNKDGKCYLMNKCHAENIIGCDKDYKSKK